MLTWLKVFPHLKFSLSQLKSTIPMLNLSYFRFSQFSVPIHCSLKQKHSWRAGQWDRSQQQSLRGSKFGGQMSILNEKSDFLYSTNFKLLSEIWENSINNCDFFFKLIISVRGDHCDYWPQAPKNLAMALLRRNLKLVFQCK
jgi:hypothetical protein